MFRIILIGLLFLIDSLAHTDEIISNTPTFSFKEIWVYLMKGEENSLTAADGKITDIGYFSAVVNDIGRLDTTIPSINSIPEAIRKKCRIHLVISAPANRSLMHLCLAEDLETRQKLIEEIVKAARLFDGVQIDFEEIRLDDRQAYWSFLKELKKNLPVDKIFSAAVMSRTSDRKDAFNYNEIASIVDKVVVMAYDEHWGTSSPGPIASLQWCEKVSNYAIKTIPPKKLVMGIPLYGRLWQENSLKPTLKHADTMNLLKQHPSTLQRDTDGTPHFKFKQSFDINVYFEDIQSINAKLKLYEKTGIESVAFWRISQEQSALWQQLKIKNL